MAVSEKTMIVLTIDFWKAFFDPSDPKNKKAQNELLVYDREKIIITQPTVFEVSRWLHEKRKENLANWFIRFSSETVNVRIFYPVKEEYENIIRISIEENIDLIHATDKYLKTHMNCDISDDF